MNSITKSSMSQSEFSSIRQMACDDSGTIIVDLFVECIPLDNIVFGKYWGAKEEIFIFCKSELSFMRRPSLDAI